MEAGEQRLSGHVLQAPPRERRPELDLAGGAGRDLAGRLGREERYGPPPTVAAGGEETRSTLRPQREARSSALETASETSPACGAAQAPTNP